MGRVSLVEIDLITVEACVVVASIDTYLKYAEAVGGSAAAARPTLEAQRQYDELAAENVTLRAQIADRAPRAARASAARPDAEVGRTSRSAPCTRGSMAGKP